MLEKGDLLTLSNNKEYIVMDQVKFENKNYVYLISKDGISGIAICLYENDSLKPVKDEDLLKKLLRKLKEENLYE